MDAMQLNVLVIVRLALSCVFKRFSHLKNFITQESVIVNYAKRERERERDLDVNP